MCVCAKKKIKTWKFLPLIVGPLICLLLLLWFESLTQYIPPHVKASFANKTPIRQWKIIEFSTTIMCTILLMPSAANIGIRRIFFLFFSLPTRPNTFITFTVSLSNIFQKQIFCYCLPTCCYCFQYLLIHSLTHSHPHIMPLVNVLLTLSVTCSKNNRWQEEHEDNERERERRVKHGVDVDRGMKVEWDVL